MKTFISLILFHAIIFLNTMHSQSLSDYQWKNRVLIIKHDGVSIELFRQQELELEGETDELRERKMLLVFYNDGVYTFKNYVKDEEHILQDGKVVKLDFQWKEEEPFEVVLIGLDGGVKLRKESPLSKEDLYAIIDGMPMRRAELNRKRE